MIFSKIFTYRLARILCRNTLTLRNWAASVAERLEALARKPKVSGLSPLLAHHAGVPFSLPVEDFIVTFKSLFRGVVIRYLFYFI